MVESLAMAQVVPCNQQNKNLLDTHQLPLTLKVELVLMVLVPLLTIIINHIKEEMGVLVSLLDQALVATAIAMDQDILINKVM